MYLLLLACWECGFASCLARCESTTQPELVGHAFHAVRRVDVLDKGDLIAGRAALSRDDGAVGEEVFPYLRDELVFIHRRREWKGVL